MYYHYYSKLQKINFVGVVQHSDHHTLPHNTIKRQTSVRKKRSKSKEVDNSLECIQINNNGDAGKINYLFSQY